MAKVQSLGSNSSQNYSKVHPRPIIIFDVMSLNMLLLKKFTHDLVFGGRHWILTNYLDRLFKQFINLNVELVFFLDGFVQHDKFPCWSRRQNEKYNKHIQLLDLIYANAITPRDIVKRHKDALYNNSLLNVIEHSCKKFGRLNYAVSYECDREIACYANEMKAFAVFSNDSDFLIFPGSWRYFSTKDIDVDTMSTKVFSRTAFRQHFKLPSQCLAIFASLVGNDFVPVKSLRKFHSKISPDINDYQTKLQNIAQFVRHNCAKYEFDNFMTTTKFFSERVFGVIDSKKEIMLATSLVFYMAYQTRDSMDCVPDQSIFVHNVVHNNAVNFTLIHFDLRHNDLGSYYDVAIPMYQRQAGAIMKMKSIVPRRITFSGKQSHESQYGRFSVDPFLPTFELPTFESMQSDDRTLDEIRHKLLKWLIDWNKFEHFNIHALPENYLIDIVTIVFMRQNKIITWKESDLLIWTIKNVNNRTISTSLEYPNVVDSRAFRITFLYSRMYANIARSIEICGLAEMYAVSFVWPVLITFI